MAPPPAQQPDELDPAAAGIPPPPLANVPETDAVLPALWSRSAYRAGVVAVAEVLLCSSIPTQLTIGALLGLAGWRPLDAAGQLSLPYVLTLSLADTVVLIALMVTLTRAHGGSATALWLGRRPITTEVLLGLLLIPAVFVIVIVVLTALRGVAPWLHNVPTNPLERLAGNSPADAAMFGLVAIFAGGVREELQRAFLLQRFERHLGGAAVGVIVLSVAFGLGHVLQGWDAVITTGTLGAFWAVVFLRRRSSVAPMISHAGFNAVEILRVALGAG